ncbi:MAG: hypothetical protein E7Z87_04310 [Cyanobacteria bacterium SIG26]|nr:hypothetical protein [Cyanobacteria bacterium SIG26]
MKKILVLICLIVFAGFGYAQETKLKSSFFDKFRNPLAKDPRAEEIKYQYNVMREDEKERMEERLDNLIPSGYMTVDQYEALSEYKERSNIDFVIPKVQTPSDFKYIPKPIYRIVKYNNPAGSVELKLGKKLFHLRQINAQGIVSPDYSMLVYPAVYYYSDSASVATDLFVIPLDKGDTDLNKILKANVAKRLPEPILSTDKAIDNYAVFRTLTPVDFNIDGTKLLVKEKLGSSEDGIWRTIIYVYDFINKVSYDLSEVRVAIVYFWQEYMNMDLDSKRWDIFPIGFDLNDPNRVIVQAYAFTGERAVALGTWSVDWQGNQSRLLSFDKDYEPKVSMNGFKIEKAGIQDYESTQIQEKIDKKESEYIIKQRKINYKKAQEIIKTDYKDAIREINDDYKQEYRDYKKLREIAGTTESAEVQEVYTQYLIDQFNKDIQKSESKIQKKMKKMEKYDIELNKLREQADNFSTNQDLQ